uniref:Uncharacterized protein n=1 Tax=Candidatus Aramenus sulfurataquae TaxID=1326980 RepID=A0AAE3FMJ5_9CREN|nr:hypothetical protein [Candidatus Aramenus sulfurataquae]
MGNEEIRQQFLDKFPYGMIDNNLREFKDKIIIRGENSELEISLKNAIAIERIWQVELKDTWKDGDEVCAQIYDIYYQRRNISINVCRNMDKDNDKGYYLEARIDGYYLFSTPISEEPRFKF